MRSKLLSTRLLPVILAIFGLCLVTNSCQNSELIDNTEFNIFYPGLTDIGPSMSASIPLGSYIGQAPSDFKIYRVTFGGETFDDAAGVFTIEAETGTINIQNSAALAVGHYALSVSCVSNGKTYEFPDIITVNMMKPVPEEIKVDPAELTIKMSDIIDGYFVPENYTAQIYSDSEAISINTYEISEVKMDGEILSGCKLFKVSTSGLVSMDLDENTTPGVYQLSFKLTTLLSGDDPQEGLFSDALTVTVSSAPLAIDYPFLPVKVEANGIARTSETPKVTGSQVDLKFEILSVNPETGAEDISIDAGTGAIIVKEGHKLQTGETFDIDIKVTNDNGSTEFTSACQIEVVDKVDEVKGFSYEAQSIVRGAGFSVEKTLEAGDDVVYSFETLPDELSLLTIDSATGIITLPKGNSLAEGTYKVNVIARNYKNSLTAELSIVVGANPFYFTYVSWGTNLVADKNDKACENQYRYPILTTEDYVLPVVSSDIPEGSENLTYAIKALTGSNAPKAEISADGTITIKGTRQTTLNSSGKEQPADRVVDIYMVTVTNGAGQNGEIVRKIPVFLHSCEEDGVATVQFTPLVCKINPRTGGTTHGVEFVNFKEEDKAKLAMDYRRSFSYYNLEGPSSHKDGAPSGKETFLKYMWDFYWFSTVESPSSNYGAKAPMSYCANSGTQVDGNGIKPKTLSMPLGYVNPAKDFGVTINPRKFTYDGAWANGLFIGQMTWMLNDGEMTEKELEDKVSGVVAGPGRISPIVIWFDPNFEN